MISIHSAADRFSYFSYFFLEGREGLLFVPSLCRSSGKFARKPRPIILDGIIVPHFFCESIYRISSVLCVFECGRILLVFFVLGVVKLKAGKRHSLPPFFVSLLTR